MTRPMILIPGLFALALGVACDDKEAPASAAPPTAPAPTAATSTQAQGGGGGPPAAAPTPAKDLPDVTAGIDKKGCDDGPGNEGARAYFVGSLTVSGDKVSGTEDSLIFANEKLKKAKIWQTDGGSDECLVRWRLEGTTTQPLACGSCDMAVEVRANVDVTGSTCPEGLWKREKQWQETYDLRKLGDGTSLWYFHKSGKQFGQGYHAGEKMNYITDPTCQWF